MFIKSFILIVFFAFCTVFADDVWQTDWSGGPGVPGPVPVWDDCFDTSDNLNWYSSPGELLLEDTINNLIYNFEHSYSENYSNSSIPDKFETTGFLVSSILEMPGYTLDDSYWGNIFWDAEQLVETSVSFRVRASFDPGNMGPWSDPIDEWGTSLEDILDDQFPYLQYEVTLATTNTAVTPILDCMLISFETDSGDVWYPETSPTLEDLNAVCFVDELHGWAVGDLGVIIVTSDGGFNWYTQESGITENLYDVDFVNLTTGWAVGANGAIINTANGGDDWNPQTSGVTATLSGVSFCDPNTGWAVGSGETILFSDNAGSNWTEQHSGVNHLHGVNCTDVDNATAVGDAGTILRTSDGGASWPGQSSGTIEQLSGVSMASQNIAWAVGSNGTIVQTSNSGQSWKTQTSGVLFDLTDVHFINMYIGWTVGTGGTILFSHSGGEVWIMQPGGRTVENIYGIHAVNIEEATAVASNGAVFSYGLPTAIEEESTLNPCVSQISVFPNPFHGYTTIGFSLNRSSDVEIYIFDLSGRLVGKTDAGTLSTGEHSIQLYFDEYGTLPAGIYNCVLRTENSETGRMIVLLN